MFHTSKNFDGNSGCGSRVGSVTTVVVAVVAVRRWCGERHATTLVVVEEQPVVKKYNKIVLV